MHLLLGAALVLVGCTFWYLQSRRRFNLQNGLAAPKYRSFHHKLVSTAIDRILSFAAWVCVIVGLVLTM